MQAVIFTNMRVNCRSQIRLRHQRSPFGCARARHSAARHYTLCTIKQHLCTHDPYSKQHTHQAQTHTQPAVSLHARRQFAAAGGSGCSTKQSVWALAREMSQNSSAALINTLGDRIKELEKCPIKYFMSLDGFPRVCSTSEKQDRLIDDANKLRNFLMRLTYDIHNEGKSVIVDDAFNRELSDELKREVVFEEEYNRIFREIELFRKEYRVATLHSQVGMYGGIALVVFAGIGLAVFTTKRSRDVIITPPPMSIDNSVTVHDNHGLDLSGWFKWKFWSA